ncbi:hypothetical protein PFISCL1PPCAC_27181, partial [Pristionchus fissidentatus]
ADAFNEYQKKRKAELAIVPKMNEEEGNVLLEEERKEWDKDYQNLLQSNRSDFPPKCLQEIETLRQGQHWGYKVASNVRVSDLRQLISYDIINDMVIDEYMHRIMEDSKRNEGGNKVYVLNHHTFNNMSDENGLKLLRKANKRNLFTFNTIFFPIHREGDHWALIVIKTDEMVVKYYDTLGWNAD